MFDSQTIYLIGFVSQGVFALTLALLAVSDRRTRGTGWLAAGSWLQLLMTSSRVILHNDREAFMKTIGSCMLVLGIFFLYMGLRWFAERRPLRTKAMPLAIAGAILAVVAISAHNVSYGMTAARLVVEVMMVIAVPMLWCTRFAGIRTTARVVASLLVGMAVTMAARTALDAAPRGHAVDLLDFGGRVLTMLLATALSFSFVSLFVAESQRRLHDETRLDSMTGLPNRRSLLEMAARLVKVAEQERTPLALLVLDVDLFKKLNDTWGHTVGDRALEALGEVLRTELSGSPCAARLGGEEFAVLLPGMDTLEAASVAEEIRRRVEKLRLHEAGHTVTLTVSVGVSGFRSGETGWIEMMRRADKALYVAKHAGRNQVSVWNDRDGIRGLQAVDSKVRHWRTAFATGVQHRADVVSIVEPTHAKVAQS